MKKIKIKYHSYDIDRLEKIKVGDWIDLRSVEDAFIPQGGYELISLGVSMKLPDGYEAHVLPRSSTFKNFGIIMTNSMGIIDNSYSGTNDIWRFPAYCLRGNEWITMENGEYFYGVRIHKGDRIAQFRIMKTQPKVEFDEVMFLDEVDRGGIGSTGVN